MYLPALYRACVARRPRYTFLFSITFMTLFTECQWETIYSASLYPLSATMQGLALTAIRCAPYRTLFCLLLCVRYRFIYSRPFGTGVTLLHLLTHCKQCHVVQDSYHVSLNVCVRKCYDIHLLPDVGGSITFQCYGYSLTTNYRHLQDRLQRSVPHGVLRSYWRIHHQFIPVGY